MKQLLTLTLVAIIGFAVAGCNKTSKVNAGATASQCNMSDCDPADCDMSKCQSMNKAGCDKMSDACPMAAAKANAKPAAAGDAASCCSSKANAKPAAAGTDCPLAGKAKPAAAGDSSCCSSKK